MAGQKGLTLVIDNSELFLDLTLRDLTEYSDKVKYIIESRDDSYLELLGKVTKIVQTMFGKIRESILADNIGNLDTILNKIEEIKNENNSK